MHEHDHLRAKAIELRRDARLSLDEIVERLNLPRTTIYYWIKDIPLGRSKRLNHIRASEVNRENARRKREDAYEQGIREMPALLEEPTFRDFIVLYMAEGLRKDRNKVDVANSNPRIIQLAHYWIQRLSRNAPYFTLQMHIDNDEQELRQFWGTLLSIDPQVIRIFRKSNSGQLKGRQWRSVHGVLSVSAHDTYLRARLQAWMDTIQEQWYTLLS